VVWIFVALLYGAVHVSTRGKGGYRLYAFAGKLNAPKAARRGIAAARQYCSAGRQAEFFDAVFTTMREYLGHKYHLPVKGLTFANVAVRAGRAARGCGVAGDRQGDIRRLRYGAVMRLAVFRRIR
jgi:hypothetical protein